MTDSSDLLALEERALAAGGADRDEALGALAALGGADAHRALIRVFRMCHWRTTRRRIVRALGTDAATERTVEFLLGLARASGDAPMQEEALSALGACRHPLAARFLERAYPRVAPYLKPAIAAALGRVPDRSLVDALLADAVAANEEGDSLFVRAALLGLSEMKATEALPLAEKVLAKPADTPTRLAALMAFGKLARDTGALARMESDLRRDSTLFSVVQLVRSQVAFRRQWSLEDYLSKAFGPQAPHPLLPTELNAFPKGDVREALDLFRDEAHAPRMLHVLRLVQHGEMPLWFAEFFPAESVDAVTMKAVLRSLQWHVGPGFRPYLGALRRRTESLGARPLMHAWLDTAALVDPDAAEMLSELFASAAYKSWEDGDRVHAINAWTHHALSWSADEPRLTSLATTTERLLGEESRAAPRARWLRALGQLGIARPSIARTCTRALSDRSVATSALRYLEACPSGEAASALLHHAPEKLESYYGAAWLRALSAQDGPMALDRKCDDLLTDALAKGRPARLRATTLEVLARHPRPRAFDAVARLASDPSSLQVAATIALKAYRDARAVTLLTPLLASPSAPVVGRAIDALASLPGQAARDALLGYLESHPTDEDNGEKIARSLEGASFENPADALVRVEAFVTAHPQHRATDGLLALRDRLTQSVAEATRRTADGAALGDMDRELAERIPYYDALDIEARAALRSAELPFHRPELFGGGVDKSMVAIEYCKAIDIAIERHFGRPRVFTKLEERLVAMQNIVVATGLHEESPPTDRVMAVLRLDRAATHEVPIYKMTLLAADVLSGRILHAHWKTLDGLRAWAAFFLLFTRPLALDGAGGLREAPFPLPLDDGPRVPMLVRRLLRIQQARNPAAHRATVLDLNSLSALRTEALSVVAELPRLLGFKSG